ncbi:MAG: UDP-3-O-(3-hydroxymyristoyl)glucosamine N-acyltransferase [Planctomycetota bacterium]|nr:UDP-3-O-(3-hydroxymyristoyl)glucosamine N-acyltransferase [Planctomycetota bacterium]
MAESMTSAVGTPLSSAEIAEQVVGVAEGDSVMIDGVADLASATASQASFVVAGASAKRVTEALESQAGLLFADADVELGGRPCIRVENPALAAALLSQLFHPWSPESGIHPTAFVHPSAVLKEGVSVGPHCTISADVHVGAGTSLAAGVVLEQGVQLGKACVVESNTVIGSNGFGFVWSGKRHERVPQTGTVVIGDRVFIGAGTTIDRGTYGPTVIGDGCILDNQVQIGHNCQLGRFVVLCAQVGLSGSTVVGDGAVFGGKASTTGHLTIGAGARLAGAAVATKDIPAGLTVGGYPAWDLRKELKAQARLRKDL